MTAKSKFGLAALLAFSLAAASAAPALADLATSRAAVDAAKSAGVVGEQGEIDVGGKSLGRFQAGDEEARKSDLIAEIISHFSL